VIGAMRGLAFGLVVGVVALVAAAPGCLSPTLPLPPPTIDAATQGMADLWEISGQCTPAARVYIENTSSAHQGGVFTTCTDAGLFQIAIGGHLCDVLLEWQDQLDGDASPNLRFVLEPFQNDAPVTPNACF
jgi:hypothetical protein